MTRMKHGEINSDEPAHCATGARADQPGLGAVEQNSSNTAEQRTDYHKKKEALTAKPPDDHSDQRADRGGQKNPEQSADERSDHSTGHAGDRHSWKGALKRFEKGFF